MAGKSLLHGCIFPLPPYWRAVLLAVLTLSAIGAVVDFKNTVKYGQIDLRNRVVGARAMLERKDPYTYNWHPGDSLLLDDPLTRSGNRLSKTTVTPAVLALHAAFSGLGYKQQKFLWLAIQWGSYLGVILLAMSLTPSPASRCLVLGTGLAFSCSAFWRLHVEVGQVPVVYGCLAAIFLALLHRRGLVLDFLAGIVLGVLICFRPQFVFLALPLFAYRRQAGLSGTALGGLLGLLIPTLLSPRVWLQYLGMLHWYLSPEPSAPHSPGAVTAEPGPAEIEGLTNIPSFYPCFPDVDSCASGILRDLAHLHLPSLIFLALVFISVVLWWLSLQRDQRAGAPIEYAVARITGLVLLTDILLPIRRLLYSDVILVPIALFFIAAAGPRLLRSTWRLFLILLAVIVSFEIKWAFIVELIPLAALLLLTITARWAPEEGTPPASADIAGAPSAPAAAG